MKWQLKTFEKLGVEELYDCIKLRLQVFIGEQGCSYADLDDIDKVSHHLFAYDENQVVAYLRIVPKGVVYDTIAMGRIVVHSDYRKQHLGYEIVKRGIDFIVSTTEETAIKIGAQAHAISFYEKLGFNVVSEEYLDEGILHKKMVYLIKK